jgi:hypothetical protein
MTLYWISFRLDDDAAHRPTYTERYKALTEAIVAASPNGPGRWHGTTSFHIFTSASDIDTLATKFKKCVLAQHDMFLMRELDSKGAVIHGFVKDQDIFKLMPYLRKV